MHTQQKNENRNKREYGAENIEDAGRYILELIKCSLHGMCPPEIPENCNWKQVVYLAVKNSVTSTISPAVKKYEGEIPEEIRKKIEEALPATVYRLLRFQIERENIFAKLEQKKIAYLPLKGILLADYYPAAGMRWMCDNDILYGNAADNRMHNEDCNADSDAERLAEELESVMTELGYMPEHVGGVHDVYQKKPFFNFEMHRKLVPEDSTFAKYYENPWDRAHLVNGKMYEYHFSDEDEYIYMLVHAYKHYDVSGCGIRTLVDEYVFLNKKNSMDWKYIEEQLEMIGLSSFEKQLRTAATNVFSPNGVMTERDWDMISYMFNCGTYGTMSNRIRRNLEKLQDENNLDQSGARRRYLKERFFVNEMFIKESYPFFYRHKKLRFVLPFYRVMKGLVTHPGTLYYEWKNIRKYR